MKSNSGFSSMVHTNGHLLCAVDVETTGLIPGFNDLIQVAIVPLDANIKPIKSVLPFYVNMKPHYPENIDSGLLKSGKVRVMEIIKSGVDPETGADFLEEWFEKLNLPITLNEHKRIMPLWTNGSFDKDFLREWLGREHYENYFHFHERDTQAVGLFLNDRYDHKAEAKLPFSRVGLTNMCEELGVVNDMAHDALQDCLATAELYRALLTRFYIPS